MKSNHSVTLQIIFTCCGTVSVGEGYALYMRLPSALSQSGQFACPRGKSNP